jgi:stearoyl-CoA desaturase (delta-9 desaturase)
MSRPTNWSNLGFIAAIHIAAIAILVWVPPTWPTLVLGSVLYCCSGLSITAGYHRLFAHRSYRCASAVRLCYLLFGAAAVQNSALTWVSDHRRHHAETDRDDDPYDARQGLWWSHIGWVLHDDPARDYSNVRDLADDRLVAWQHRFYGLIAVIMAGGVPSLIAWSWGDPPGGLLWGGCIRVVAQYHSAFAINSIAHRYGRRPYSRTTSARDNVLVAFVTLGEGYHNFHHRFPSDYRNGVRWFDFDPTKWVIRALAAAGVASGLRRASPDAIARARQKHLESM